VIMVLDGEGRFGGAFRRLGGRGGYWKNVWVKKRVLGRLWSRLSEGHQVLTWDLRLCEASQSVPR
jgi:hypothetical protein